MKTFIEELKWRESFKQSIGEENKLSDLIENKKISVYVGTDPTAPSLHIGHLIPLTILKRLQKLGHKPVIVVGGGTGMIGDPKPTTERKLLSEDQLNEYVQRLTKQLTKLFGSDGFEIINNYNWLGKLSLIEFLRDYGKFFPVNEMLKRDVVANRIETGISFTEFTYQILQAIDFLVLYKEKKVQLQIGGSDQFGNISSGVELIHKVLGSDKEAYGITVPLLLKSDGTKFGKSEGGAIWLDSQLTSPYNLYQFFFNQSDNDVIRFLKIFTFLSKEEIADYEEKVKNNPEKREAQT
ncbi:MAG: tyrosine--tRNA ligase, partial [Lactobacillaceae bacterium]|nr:tyrosine--tRNA ligase [Lactobacillaceae bacterium]